LPGPINGAYLPAAIETMKLGSARTSKEIFISRGKKYSKEITW